MNLYNVVQYKDGKTRVVSDPLPIGKAVKLSSFLNTQDDTDTYILQFAGETKNG